jgi:hypothetical protein
MKNAYAVLAGKCERKEIIWKTWTLKVDNIKMNLKIIRCEVVD